MLGPSALRSDGAQIGCRGLSAVGHNVERDFLSLVEIVHPGAFDGADVDEYVLTAVIRLDEAEALLAVESLYVIGAGRLTEFEQFQARSNAPEPFSPHERESVRLHPRVTGRR